MALRGRRRIKEEKGKRDGSSIRKKEKLILGWEEVAIIQLLLLPL